MDCFGREYKGKVTSGEDGKCEAIEYFVNMP